MKNEGVKVQKGEAKSTKRRSRRFNGPFEFPIDPTLCQCDECKLAWREWRKELAGFCAARPDCLPLQLRRPMPTWENCLRVVARAAGVTPQKVAEVVQATTALAIEELKTK